jgi:uncharacterized protein (DUF1501 family)
LRFINDVTSVCLKMRRYLEKCGGSGRAGATAGFHHLRVAARNAIARRPALVFLLLRGRCDGRNKPQAVGDFDGWRRLYSRQNFGMLG